MKRQRGFTLVEVICYITLILVFFTAFLRVVTFSLSKAGQISLKNILDQKSENLELFIKNQLCYGDNIKSLQDGDTLVSYVVFSKRYGSPNLFDVSKKRIYLSRYKTLMLETKNATYKKNADSYIRVSEKTGTDNVVEESVESAESYEKAGRAYFEIKTTKKGEEEVIDFDLPFESGRFDFLDD